MVGRVRTHVDLFSGIGGFSLAARWAGVETIAFAETDNYASRVLERHFSGVRNYGDVRNVPAMDAWLVTGGVPCQPASVAGKRRGAEDDRWLWPEALAAVERIMPSWVCLENPLGILSLEQPGLSFDLEGYGHLIDAAIRGEGDSWADITGTAEFIFRDLTTSIEELGYKVVPVIVPACGLGAWHRRYRVWIMGHATGVQPRAEQQSTRSDLAGHSSPESLSNPDGARQLQPQGRIKKQRGRTSDGSAKAVSVTDSDGGAARISRSHERQEGNPSQPINRGSLVANAESIGRELRASPAKRPRRFASNGANAAHTEDTDGRRSNGTHNAGWGNPQVGGRSESDGGLQHWATEPNVGRVANGVPSRLDRLRTLGNAIVPQVAYQLIKRMIEAEEAVYDT